MMIKLEQKQKRLTSGKKGCYDKVGNREQVTENAITTPYNPNILNQYDSVNANPLNYDLNGNLIAQNGWNYQYDAQNRLIQASNSTTLASFNYDARNRCVSRTINGNTTYLYYDDWNLIEERDPSDNLTTVYFHGAQIDELLLKITLTNTVYYHHDAIGNVNQLTDKNGHVLEKYVYDAFGSATILNSVNQVLQASSYANRFLFTGREYLKELRLYDYRNRVYSAHLGRFLQTDPIKFLGGDRNLYRYCNNNSINRIDPNGLFWSWAFAGGGAVIGGAGGASAYIGHEIGQALAGRGFHPTLSEYVGSVAAGAGAGFLGGGLIGAATGDPTAAAVGITAAAGLAGGALGGYLEGLIDKKSDKQNLDDEGGGIKPDPDPKDPKDTDSDGDPDYNDKDDDDDGVPDDLDFHPKDPEQC